MPLESLTAVETVEAGKRDATPAEPAAVRRHLDKVLGGAAFRQSKRYAAVLRFMVEQRLEGGEAHVLKERVIGVEIFGRAPDYDTAADHVVRSAAAEIRKRLAQYYQEEGADDDLRIDLRRGTYVPDFRRVNEPEVPARLGPIEAEPPTRQAAADLPRARSVAVWQIALLVAAALLACMLLPWTRGQANSSLTRFWGPLLASNKPALICVGTLGGGHQEGAPPIADTRMSLSDFHVFDYESVHMDDAETLARIAGLMQSQGKPYQIASQSAATYDDLQRGPTVLIGLKNNDWTERLLQNLRFSVVRRSPNVLGIRDRNNPNDDRWSVDFSTPYLSLTRDYAILGRSTDPKTGQKVVTIAGLTVFGTMGAGRFVTDPDEVKMIDAIAPSDWANRNLELVLSVDIIRGVPGRPVIVASRFW